MIVLAGRGPLGSGMEETYQITSALKHLDWGRDVAVVTDARFSGVSTGACIGHVGPEALAGGPIGKVHDGDRIQIIVDCKRLTGSVDLVGDRERMFEPGEAERSSRRAAACGAIIKPDDRLPADTRLWAALQAASGGAWAGCVYDVERIIRLLEAGAKAQGRRIRDLPNGKRVGRLPWAWAALRHATALLAPTAKLRFLQQHRLANQLKRQSRVRPAERGQQTVEFLRRAFPFQIDEQQPAVAIEQVAVDLPLRLRPAASRRRTNRRARRSFAAIVRAARPLLRS